MTATQKYFKSAQHVAPKLPAFQMQLIVDFANTQQGNSDTEKIFNTLKQLNPVMYEEVIGTEFEEPAKVYELLDYISGTTMYSEAAAEIAGKKIEEEYNKLPWYKKVIEYIKRRWRLL